VDFGPQFAYNVSHALGSIQGKEKNHGKEEGYQEAQKGQLPATYQTTHGGRQARTIGLEAF
jgi:hypothetical protein